MSDDGGMRTDGDQRTRSARGSIGKNRNFCPNKQLNLLETIGGGSWEWEREEGAGAGGGFSTIAVSLLLFTTAIFYSPPVAGLKVSHAVVF